MHAGDVDLRPRDQENGRSVGIRPECLGRACLLARLQPAARHEYLGPLKRQTLTEYGLPASAGRRTEADHLYPRWLGGATVRQNFWPEPNYTHTSGFNRNPKDVLESKLYQMTCQARTMTVARARRIFAGDWRRAYRRYVAPTITNR